MPDSRQDPAKNSKDKVGAKVPPTEPKQAREVLREQAKTEIEERPYLDTEGGE